jgi:hypothetical protein
VTLAVTGDTFVVGSTYLVKAYGARTGTNNVAATVHVRVGTTTSATAGNIAATNTLGATATAGPLEISVLMTVRSIGISGTILGSATTHYNGSTVTTNTTTAVAVDTTATNYIKLTMNSGATNTYTFYVASITQVS